MDKHSNKTNKLNLPTHFDALKLIDEINEWGNEGGFMLTTELERKRQEKN